jgi:hypothetical protein
MLLIALVAVLFLYMGAFRLYHRGRAAYRARRRKVFAPAIELVLLEEPYEKVLAALTPRYPGDLDVVQELIVEHIRFLQGAPFDTLRRCAQGLGIFSKNLERLSSRRRLVRGRAMDVLGVLKSKEAVVLLSEGIEAVPLDLKLVALRSLAAIGDPLALPAFTKAADTVPPAMLVRLVSLMMEFGPASWPWIHILLSRHRESFPPRVLAQVLKELAASETRP